MTTYYFMNPYDVKIAIVGTDMFAHVKAYRADVGEGDYGDRGLTVHTTDGSCCLRFLESVLSNRLDVSCSVGGEEALCGQIVSLNFWAPDSVEFYVDCGLEESARTVQP